MAPILVGTASWSDKSLIDSGLFYPPDVSTPAGRLEYYAQRYPLVEVDTSFYGIPAVRSSMQWAQRTPPGFVFDVKAFRLFTQHQTDPHVLPKEVRQALGRIPPKNVHYDDLPAELRDELWQQFQLALEPLRRAGKLGVALFQFPPWFVPSGAHFDHIRECQARLPGVQLAVEFRNKAWFEGDRPGRVWQFLRDHRMAYVVVDEPQGFASSVPQLWEVTCPDVAVVRLHGRNRDTWEGKGLKSSGERFHYLYGQDEMAELAAGARTLAHQAAAVHVLFNNCAGDYAQRNAAQFLALVR
ncbi:MAG TPA: DUF72 domain-containing protein [Rhodocyclaceae bacterium]